MSVEANLSNTKLVFVHIPKTGGTSVHHFFRDFFNKDEICPERFRGLGKYTEQELESYRFFSGHFFLNSTKRIPGQKFVFTILRNPKDRIISLYYFWRRHKEDVATQGRLNGPLVARSHDLLDFLKINNPLPRNAIKNEITRVFAGNISTEDGDRYKERNDYVSKFDIMRRAVSALATINYVGFMDSLEEDINYICEMLQISEKPLLQRLNYRNEKKPVLEEVLEEPITPEIDHILDSLTDLDRIFYEIARFRRELILKQR